MRYRQLIASVFILCLLSLAGLGARSEPSSTDLDPSRPREYLEAGELAVARAQRSDDIQAARRILAMGAVLAMEQGDPQTAGSCCIALAYTHEQDPDIMQQLWDLTLQIDSGRLTQWARFRQSFASTQMMEDAAECIRLARIAEYGDSTELLDRDEVEDVIRSTAMMLGFNPGAILSSLRIQIGRAGRDPCNGNYFDSRVENGSSVRRVCREHTYPIGTAENRNVLEQFLAVEFACMGDASQIHDWGGARALGLNAPLRDPSIDWLIDHYGIDPSRPAYRNGRWVREP